MDSGIGMPTVAARPKRAWLHTDAAAPTHSTNPVHVTADSYIEDDDQP
jgi:hypothetical protein